MLHHRRCQSALPVISLDKAPLQPNLFQAARSITGEAAASSTAARRPARLSTPPPRTPPAALSSKPAPPPPRTPPHHSAASQASPPPTPKKQRVGLGIRDNAAQTRKIQDSPSEEEDKRARKRGVSPTAEDERERKRWAGEDGSAFWISGGSESLGVPEVLETRITRIVEEERSEVEE